MSNKPTFSKTDFKGVVYNEDMKAYKATIYYKRKPVHLGYCDTAEQAFVAYCRASALLHQGERNLDTEQVKASLAGTEPMMRFQIRESIKQRLLSKNLI